MAILRLMTVTCNCGLIKVFLLGKSNSVIDATYNFEVVAKIMSGN